MNFEYSYYVRNDEAVVTRNLKCRNDAGFSLLEMLVSLAILSLTSLALFQSTSTLLNVSDKASNRSVTLAEDFITRNSFYQVVGGLVPGWPDQEDTIFRGNKLSFSGLSNQVGFQGKNGLQSFKLRLVPGRGSSKQSLSLEMVGGQWIIEDFDVNALEFRYLGIDQNWYEAWPPKKTPSTGYFNDHLFMSTPDMPVAIMIKRAESPADRNESFSNWIAVVSTTREKPYRGNDASAF